MESRGGRGRALRRVPSGEGGRSRAAMAVKSRVSGPEMREG